MFWVKTRCSRWLSVLARLLRVGWCCARVQCATLVRGARFNGPNSGEERGLDRAGPIT